MPFAVRRKPGTDSEGNKTEWAVVNTDTGRVVGRHKSKAGAIMQLAALQAQGAADDKSADPLLVVPIE